MFSLQNLDVDSRFDFDESLHDAFQPQIEFLLWSGTNLFDEHLESFAGVVQRDDLAMRLFDTFEELLAPRKERSLQHEALVESVVGRGG